MLLPIFVIEAISHRKVLWELAAFLSVHYFLLAVFVAYDEFLAQLVFGRIVRDDARKEADVALLLLLIYLQAERVLNEDFG